MSTALLLLTASCGRHERPTATRQAVAVTTVTVQPKDVPKVYEFVGTTESSRKVQIRARVDGFLDERVYAEGTMVERGQKLFVMDKKPFEARLSAAKAALGEQEARLRTADANLARVKPLAAQNAVSQKELDDATGQQQAAAAAVEAAKAAVTDAELQLGYTTIESPLRGLSSYAQVEDGTYVSVSNSLLTTISAITPIRVSFSVSENQVLRARDEVAQGRLRFPKDDAFVVEIVLADGSLFGEKGKITFRDAEFSEQTGTFLIRAEFPNADETLRPGQFVRVHLTGAVRPEAVLVPKVAVQQGAKGSFVFTVKDGKAERRPVTMGDWVGDDWIVEQGLQAGDVVVVEGAIKLSPGAPVSVVPDKRAVPDDGPRDSGEAK